MSQVVAKVAPNWTHFIEVFPQTYPSPCTSNLSSVNAGSGFGFGGLDVVAAGQVAHKPTHAEISHPPHPIARPSKTLREKKG
jgi:hypothetical protein